MKRIMYSLLFIFVLLNIIFINYDFSYVSANEDNTIILPANASWGETYPYGNWSTQPIYIIKEDDGNSCLKMQPVEWYPELLGFKKDISTDVLKAGDYQVKIDVKSSGIDSVKKGKIDLILVYEGGEIKISDGVFNLGNINGTNWTTLTFDFKVNTDINSSFVNLDAFYWPEETLENNYLLIDNIRFVEKDQDKNLDKIFGGDFELFFYQATNVVLDIKNNFTIGKKVDTDVKIQLEGKTPTSIYACSDILIGYEVENDDVLISDMNGNLIPIAKGTTKVKAVVKFFGKELISNEVEVNIGELNEPVDVYIEHVGISLDKDLSATSYSQISVSVLLSDGSFISENDYKLTLSTTNKNVVYIRNDKPLVCIGIGDGDASIYATVEYNGYCSIGYVDVSLNTGNYLINSSYEAEGYGWSMVGKAGGGYDNLKTNGFARTGYGNIWLMAPVYWDANVKPESDVKISQVVNLETGKYALTTYINRFFATGPNGLINGVGGLVTIGAVKVDDNHNIVGESIEAEFDTGYGNNEYSKLSLVFDVTESAKYLIYIKVVGDTELGLGMQIDDTTLRKAEYPKSITATITEESIEVDDLYKIMVYAVYSDGTKELLTSDLRFIFDDYRVACDSKGFVVGRAPGETNVKVKALILDRVFETSFTVKVNGSVLSDDIPDEKSSLGLYIGLSIGCIAFVGGVSAATIIIIKKRKKVS